MFYAKGQLFALWKLILCRAPATLPAWPTVSKARRSHGILEASRQQQTSTLVSWRLQEARAICLASFRASIRMMANSNSSCQGGGCDQPQGKCVKTGQKRFHIQEMKGPRECVMTGTQRKHTLWLSCTINTSADHEIRV